MQIRATPSLPPTAGRVPRKGNEGRCGQEGGETLQGHSGVEVTGVEVANPVTRNGMNCTNDLWRSLTRHFSLKKADFDKA
mmetsp:Transcript_62624/g.104125  ORF Transcript_62624/g.104125 Transcript_62624/m.104125 type:complete len:80 (+) Transcript_62624:528-767(+)|eukprot:CAMPEP_0174383234 /NCGR_PEP_ID=MMETSP0811_2-20130205/125094_1 /TAXON_ID=73025 ORGANISM="Eutreptiella gymnastica-like, Strain CCMP1594" /NCGR_SAMPLE_ID=MMETSP0811_2 /ASSEMBLY_ACC=CAM_ASM_000667 /LENGTH=79 /DNA_ID=CAMNT_0015536741 /DNA_START=528 /DNA_END=767 /DNA_ORIENTATION=+